jgi:hypothetical protein
MSKSRKRGVTSSDNSPKGTERTVGTSRRNFLKTAAVAASGVLMRESLWAQGKPLPASSRSFAFPKINKPFLMTPDQAWEWNVFKSQGGPTYAGSVGWKRYTDFLISKMQECGAVDFDYVKIPYDHYIVEDWPDRGTHEYKSGKAVEKLVTDGTPVPAVASYGMTSGFTPPEGVTAQLLYYDLEHPPADAQIAGKILVFQTPPYPEPPYTNAFMDSFTLTDYEWRSPGKWSPLFVPPPTSVTSSYHSRWAWSQLNRAAAIGIKGRAAGIVMVYDLSPGAALGLAQRSVYTPDGKAGPQTSFVNCPTLTLDRVNGAKVLVDAKAGKTATLTLNARFQKDEGKAIVAYLPGKNYGTPLDEQVLLATHTDAMSLVEENGGLGMLGILSYFNHIPQSSRPRTLLFFFDCRHFMPGGEGSWPQFDYYTIHPERLKTIVATVGIEHMGGKQTIEVGPGGNEYVYSKELPENGGVITSLFAVHNNNMWLVDTIARGATDNHWPRVDVKSGPGAPGVNGGFQGSVKGFLNLGRVRTLPGIALAADWPGAATQTYAQLDTEAGPHGFDKDHFVQQVAGLSQMAGDLMMVKPLVIDLGWGNLKTSLVTLPDSGFVSTQSAATQRQMLVNQYTAVFKKVEAGTYDDARSELKSLAANVSSWVAPDKQAPVKELVDGQLSKLS